MKKCWIKRWSIVEDRSLGYGWSLPRKEVDWTFTRRGALSVARDINAIEGDEILFVERRVR